MDLPNDKRRCHHTGFAKKCRTLVISGQCERWMQIAGKNPNTGEDVNRCGCIDDWGPMLMIENSQQQRQTGAAVESFRNEMVKANHASVVMTRTAIATALGARSMLPVAEPAQITHQD